MEKIERRGRSPLRGLTERILTPPVKLLARWGIKPDQVTKAGTFLTGVGGFLKVVENKIGEDLSLPALGLMAIGFACDGLDGLLARSLGIASNEGAILDVVNDRVQESMLAGFRMMMAAERGDWLGWLMALVVGLANPFPSYFRAEVESHGLSVRESGGNFLSFFGTRGGRGTFSIIGTSFGERQVEGNYSLQSLIDMFLAWANLLSCAERVKELLKIDVIKKELQEEGFTLDELLETLGDIEVNEDLKRLGQRKIEVLRRFIPINSFVFLSLGIFGFLRLIDRYFPQK